MQHSALLHALHHKLLLARKDGDDHSVCLNEHKSASLVASLTYKYSCSQQTIFCSRVQRWRSYTTSDVDRGVPEVFALQPRFTFAEVNSHLMGCGKLADVRFRFW